MPSDDEILDYILAKQLEIENLKRNNLKTINKKRFKFEIIKGYAENFINRDHYYSRLIVMPGLRGIGKTTLLYQLHDFLVNEKEIPYKDILYLDVNDLRLSFNINIKEVVDTFINHLHRTTISALNHKIFLLVDEAHLDKNWAKVARLLFDKTSNIFMIFTGSSALELNTTADATRRMTVEEILPCNFKEYLFLEYGTCLKTDVLRNAILRQDDESILEFIECEEKILEQLLSIGNDLELELRKFIYTKSYPFALEMEEFESYRYINHTVNRIIRDDLEDFKEFNSITTTKIAQLISYLATKKPGSTSKQVLSQALSMDVKTITKILEVLEESKLLFSVHAYGSSGKMLKKQVEHFFTTPSIKSALNYRIKRYDLNDNKCFSVLIENMVASTIHNISNDSFSQVGLFYDGAKKGVDFIIRVQEKIIPVEVGIGKKTKSQLIRSMNKYDAEMGILVSDRTSHVKYYNNILYVPVAIFALI